MRILAPLALALVVCGPVTQPGSAPPASSGAPSSTPTPAPLASVASGPAPSLSFATKDCSSGQAGQFDFWVGTWDVAWQGATGPLTGTNTVTKQAGCVIVEHFDGPLGGVQGYVGNSAAAWVPSLGKWQQNYIDTTGFSGTYVGGVDGTAFILYRATAGGAIANTGRLVWKDISADRLTWTNDRSIDNGATWQVGLVITYTRWR